MPRFDLAKVCTSRSLDIKTRALQLPDLSLNSKHGFWALLSTEKVSMCVYQHFLTPTYFGRVQHYGKGCALSVAHLQPLLDLESVPRRPHPHRAHGAHRWHLPLRLWWMWNRLIISEVPVNLPCRLVRTQSLPPQYLHLQPSHPRHPYQREELVLSTRGQTSILY